MLSHRHRACSKNHQLCVSSVRVPWSSRLDCIDMNMGPLGMPKWMVSSTLNLFGPAVARRKAAKVEKMGHFRSTNRSKIFNGNPTSGKQWHLRGPETFWLSYSSTSFCNLRVTPPVRNIEKKKSTQCARASSACGVCPVRGLLAGHAPTLLPRPATPSQQQANSTTWTATANFSLLMVAFSESSLRRLCSCTNHEQQGRRHHDTSANPGNHALME